MKILFISSWFPYPPINGAKIRIYNLIRQLAKNHSISLLSYTQSIPIEDTHKSIPELSKYCETIKVIPFDNFDPRRISTYRGFFSKYPRFIVQTYSLDMSATINESIEHEYHDVIVASEVGAPSVVSLYASRIKGIPKILDALEITLYKDAYYGQTNPFKRVRSGLTWFKYRRFIREVLNHSNACTVPSKEEESNLREFMPANYPIEVIPHSLDIAYYQGNYGPIEPQSLAFTGSFTYHANFDAISFFLDEIYPFIKSKAPGIITKIIGDNNHVELAKLPIDDSLIFTGLIKDVRPEVARSWLSIVPLRIGAGTRLKIIESMALGTPVVSTSKGAEGLDVTHGENIILADDPREFAKAVLAVTGSKNLREKLSIAGRQLVSEKYSSEYMGMKFDALISRLAEN